MPTGFVQQHRAARRLVSAGWRVGLLVLVAGPLLDSCKFLGRSQGLREPDRRIVGDMRCATSYLCLGALLAAQTVTATDPCPGIDGSGRVRVYVGRQWLDGCPVASNEERLVLRSTDDGETLRIDWVKVQAMQRFTGWSRPSAGHGARGALVGAAAGYSVGALASAWVNLRSFMCESGCAPDVDYRPQVAVVGAAVGLILGLGTDREQWAAVSFADGRIDVSLRHDGRPGALVSVRF
jgi:hypothetical protein